MNKSDHPTTEPAESEGKNLAAKIHLSDEDTALLEEFRNAVQKPTAPPEDALEDARAWGMLAEFEMSGSYWRDRDTVRFAIEYAAKLLAERDKRIPTPADGLREASECLEMFGIRLAAEAKSTATSPLRARQCEIRSNAIFTVLDALKERRND